MGCCFLPPATTIEAVIHPRPFVLGCGEGNMYLFILYGEALSARLIATGLKLVLDGGENDNRKEECTGGPYLGAPGLCDGKCQEGKEEAGSDVTRKDTCIYLSVHTHKHTSTKHFLPNKQCWRDRQLPSFSSSGSGSSV